jgi:hypothetical protein
VRRRPAGAPGSAEIADLRPVPSLVADQHTTRPGSFHRLHPMAVTTPTSAWATTSWAGTGTAYGMLLTGVASAVPLVAPNR